MQLVSYDDAVAKNSASSVGRLSLLATVFVLVSIVATILSRGCEFAAGESKLWVFWAVSAPVLVAEIFLLWLPVDHIFALSSKGVLPS